MSEMRLSSSSRSSDYSGGYSSYSAPTPSPGFPGVNPESPAFKAVVEAVSDNLLTGLSPKEFETLLLQCDSDPKFVLERIKNAREMAGLKKLREMPAFPLDPPPLPAPSFLPEPLPPMPFMNREPDTPFQGRKLPVYPKEPNSADSICQGPSAQDVAQREATTAAAVERLAARKAQREDEARKARERATAESAATEKAAATAAAAPAPVERIRFLCGCGRKINARSEYAGHAANCPACGHGFVVPRASDVIVFACRCGKAIQAKAQYAGRRFDCPQCAEALTVPGHESPSGAR